MLKRREAFSLPALRCGLYVARASADLDGGLGHTQRHPSRRCCCCVGAGKQGVAKAPVLFIPGSRGIYEQVRPLQRVCTRRPLRLPRSTRDECVPRHTAQFALSLAWCNLPSPPPGALPCLGDLPPVLPHPRRPQGQPDVVPHGHAARAVGLRRRHAGGWVHLDPLRAGAAA